MKQLIRRLTTIICAMMLCIMAVNAQSSGDKLYNQGLALQKTMTKSAQNQAISKFQSAKKLYDSAAKKKQCDDAIAVSKGIISSLGSGSKSSEKGSSNPSKSQGASKQKSTKEEHQVAATLSLSNRIFHPGKEGAEMEISVTTNQKEWSVTSVADRDGSSFVKVEKLNDNVFKIIVPENPTAAARSQYVQVAAGNAKERVEVTQLGREIELKADKTSLQVGKKAKKEKLTIECNSDESYSETYGNNWRVYKAPEWVKVVAEAPQGKSSKGDLISKGKTLINGVGSFVSGKVADQTVVKSKATVYIEPLPDNEASRDGEIVIESGYKTFNIVVIQTR